MALERWLYEQLDQGEDIKPWLHRIIAESRSQAFAGLLLDVGKRQPQLLVTALLPLVRVWELYEYDIGTTLQRTTLITGLMGWGMESPKLAAIAKEWYTLPHRCHLLRDIMAHIMWNRAELRPLFEELRADWTSLLDAAG